MIDQHPAHKRLQTTPRELRGQLTILVVVLWAICVLNTANWGLPLWNGHVKGSDFLHFYALARIGSDDVTQFANPSRVRAAQLSAVPESEDHVYPPVYGPQVAIALAPLARFRYGAALLIWTAVIATMYFAAMAVVLKHTVVVRSYFSLGLLAAAGFPPFWYLVQYGQLSAVALCLIVASAMALNRGRELITGAILGLLLYKPPLFLPVFGILLLSGSWRIAGVMSLSGGVEVLSTVLWIGVEGIENYLRLTLRLPTMASMMAARPDQMHSLRAFWFLLFRDSHLTAIMYVMSAVAAMIAAAYVWRRVADPSIRMSALLLGAVLASPHLYVYDLVILAPVLVWLTEWYLTQPLIKNVGRALYVAYLAPLFGYAAPAVPLQLSVLCFAYLLMSLSWWVLGGGRQPDRIDCPQAQPA